MSTTSRQHLVIFGCGYLGTSVARAAVAGGLRVTALTRNPAKAEALRHEGIDVVVADLATPDWHAAIAPGADFVVNCVSSGGGGLEGYRHSYIDGMRSIVAWAAAGAAPVGTFVYTSSTSVYPQGGGVVVNEDARPLATVGGGGALVEAEQQLLAAAGLGRRFILRLAGIYGPGRHLLLDQIRDGVTAMSGLPGNHLNLVHRDDAVAAILACLRAPADVAGGVFNVADGRPGTKAEVVAWLAARLGRPAPVWDGVARPSPRRGGEPVPDRIIASDRLQRALGWQPAFPDFRRGYTAILGASAD